MAEIGLLLVAISAYPTRAAHRPPAGLTTMVFPQRMLILAAFFISVIAIPPGGTPPRVARGSSKRSVPTGWSLHRRADPDAVLFLKFALVQSNLHNLEAYLLDIADPHSPNYGNHWSPAKVEETFRPSKESVDTVHSWLVDDLGIDARKIQLNRKGDAVQLNITVAEAESILGAEYYVYRYGDEGHERVGCHEGYSLPEHVSKHVDFVWPTTYFGRSPLGRRDGKAPNPALLQGPALKKEVNPSKLTAMDCDEAVTLDCLRDLYKFHYTPVFGQKNSVAVAEFDEEIFLPSDNDVFFQKYEPSLVGHQPTVVSIDGGNISTGFTGESGLDLELVMGLLGPKQNVTLFQVGDSNFDQIEMDALLGAFDDSFCELDGVSSQGLSDCGDKKLTNVISISYHFEPDFLDSEITPIVNRECHEIGKLSLTGRTFIASSGDGGVAYSQAHGCLVNGSLTLFNPPNSSFVGQFPASCPFVTAVGATSVAPGNSVKDPEIATTAFPSGGGFSNNFGRPSWQEAAVSNYLEHFAPSYGSDVFNRSGRAYPDVAANGFPIVIVLDGEFVLSGGTSASAPIFAAIVTALNDARLAVGKKPVGWLNPALYSPLLAHAYNDVTNGTNPGCGTEGFVAAPGWDPVTGLGTPNFPKLLAAFLLLP